MKKLRFIAPNRQAQSLGWFICMSYKGHIYTICTYFYRTDNDCNKVALKDLWPYNIYDIFSYLFLINGYLLDFIYELRIDSADSFRDIFVLLLGNKADFELLEQCGCQYECY